jgi:hypothetical protein
MFRSQLSDHPQGSSFVLECYYYSFRLLASSIWYVAVCCLCVCVSGVPAYVMSGRESDRRSKQAERVVIALAQRTTTEDGQITATETCWVFN